MAALQNRAILSVLLIFIENSLILTISLRHQDLRTAFELIDSNQDGRINAEEFKIMLNNLGIELADEKVRELMKSASHGSELIDENDFLSWIKKIQDLCPDCKSEDASEELMEAFRVFDLDRNGYITRDELRTAMEMIGEPVTETQLTEFIDMADTDKDGRINYEGKKFPDKSSIKHNFLEFARLLL